MSSVRYLDYVLNQELERNPWYPCKVGGVLKEGSAH